MAAPVVPPVPAAAVPGAKLLIAVYVRRGEWLRIAGNEEPRRDAAGPDAEAAGGPPVRHADAEEWLRIQVMIVTSRSFQMLKLQVGQ